MSLKFTVHINRILTILMKFYIFCIYTINYHEIGISIDTNNA